MGPLALVTVGAVGGTVVATVAIARPFGCAPLATVFCPTMACDGSVSIKLVSMTTTLGWGPDLFATNPATTSLFPSGLTATWMYSGGLKNESNDTSVCGSSWPKVFEAGLRSSAVAEKEPAGSYPTK